MRRKRALDDSDSESESADSDDNSNRQPVNSSQSKLNASQTKSASNSGLSVKQKATARRRLSAMKALIQQDDSDDDGASTRPNSPQNGVLSSLDDSDDDPDYVVDSTKKRKTPTIPRPFRSPIINKRQRLQNGTRRIPSPQPSTSQVLQNGTSQNAQESEDESDSSGSESADSDYGPFNERSHAKKKTAAKARKKLPQRTAKNKPSNYAGSNSNRQPVNSSQSKLNASHTKNSNRQPVNISHVKMNASLRKGSKLNQAPDPSTDSKLVESLAQKLVYFLLIEDQKKYAIRRKAIVTQVFTDDYSPKLYIAVIKKANLLLKKNYGMELLQIEYPKDSYLIINILRPELGIHEFVDVSRMKQQQYALISFLLTVIYMNDNVITEDELTRCLKPLGIDWASKNHPVFGDVKKYVTTELVKQMYLNYDCVSKDPPKYELTWGERAKQEVDKRDLLQFFCTIMDDTSPEDWRMQYRDAEKDVETNARENSIK